MLDTSLLAGGVLRHVLFGAHPYGATVGTSKQTREVRREELVALHPRVFDPARLSIVVAGSASQSEVVDALNDAFGPQKPSSPAHPLAIPPPAPAPASTARVILVDRPGHSIASIAAGVLSPPSGAADDEAMQVAVSALADSSLGRMTKRLRDELGYASSLTPLDVPHRTPQAAWPGGRRASQPRMSERH